MKPIKHMPTMATLDLTSGFPDSDMALPLRLQACAFFLQKDIGEHHQGPEAHNGPDAHQLILIQAQFFLAIAKEDFDIPTSCDVQEQRLRARFHITRSPIACLRHRGIQRLPHDHDLATVQAAHPCCHDMHVNRLFSFGPGQLDVVARAQLSRLLRQALPLPAFGRAWVCDGKPAIALDPSRDQKLPLPCGSPEAFGTVPAIKQDMRERSRDRLKRADCGFHQLDLTLEGDAFHFTDFLLSIQLGSQGTAPPQQHIQTLDQAMTGHAFVFGRRMMPAQSLHLLGFALVPRPRHPQSGTLSRRVLWDGLDAWAVSGALAATLLPLLAPSLPGNASTSFRPRRPLPMALATKSDSVLPNWVYRQSAPTSPRAFAPLRRASTPTVRSRSTGTGVS